LAEKQQEKKAYVKPEVRQIKLSLAELTLGTACDIANPSVQSGACQPIGGICNI